MPGGGWGDSIERVRDPGSPRVDAAAEIWARATAARDGEAEVAPLAISKPMIEAVLRVSPRSLLLVAQDEGTALGFAAIEPIGTEEPATALVRYLGVHPAAWGKGVGRALMAAIPPALAGSGFDRVALTVYVHNERAIALYSGAGWVSKGAPVRNPRTGRMAERYELDL